MKTNVIQEKSFAFAVRIVRLSRHLINDSNERVLSNQVLRSGTSIGSNVEEAIAGQSKKDFVNKLQIARKEARETVYWLRLLAATETLQEKHLASLVTEAEELVKILTSIIKSTAETVNEQEVPYG